MHLVDIAKQIQALQNLRIAEACDLHPRLGARAGVDGITQRILPGLAVEAIDHGIDCLRLIGLRLELDLHGCRFLKSSASCVVSFVGCSRFIRSASRPGQASNQR